MKERVRKERVAEPETPMDPRSHHGKRNRVMVRVVEIVKKSRGASASGPNGLPYKVYKKVPEDLENLCKILKVVKRKGKITNHAGSKHRAVSSLKKRSRTIFTQFRTIFLVEVEGKIFFSVRFGMTDDIIHDAEQLRKYISPDRWNAWILRMR